MTLRNFTRDNIGVYRCTASNDVGEENCTIEVSIQRESEEVEEGAVGGGVVVVSSFHRPLLCQPVVRLDHVTCAKSTLPLLS